MGFDGWLLSMTSAYNIAVDAKVQSNYNSYLIYDLTYLMFNDFVSHIVCKHHCSGPLERTHNIGSLC